MGAFCCHGHQSFDPICLKTLCSLSPPPVMLQIQFDQDWPTGLRDIQVPKCKIFIIQGQVAPVSSLIRPKIKPIQAFTPVLVTSNFDDDSIKNERASMETAVSHYKSASIKRIRSKMTEKKWRHRFPHYKSMGAFCCHGNQSFDPICPKTLCSLSPTPVMLHIKFDQD